ncbi:MAG: hydrogenase maturation protease [Magnetococcales bacterium]|nr:hydrogenase maturation protease [Magnetococcales bacterium]MBF0150787.1 hydrogenase maturation protease [Magnetococcales bacterium]MBF0174004.1 hydrogenase maturation protease [Magnetococcales bacterium]MBF0348773.1 hydrogenase maturation protease [Magnetococcales bacterium]MBF0631883.1 hydrogenase maturation protease [Magnetococcales bacterium]
MRRCLVVGLGNPILSDDGVGVAVIHALQQQKWTGTSIDFIEGNVGGLHLMERLVGYDDALIIDAMITRTHPPGWIIRGDFGDWPGARHTWSSHDTRLSVALELGLSIGMKLPARIRVWGIEVRDVDTFGLTMTPEVAAAIPQVVREVREYLILLCHIH